MPYLPETKAGDRHVAGQSGGMYIALQTAQPSGPEGPSSPEFPCVSQASAPRPTRLFSPNSLCAQTWVTQAGYLPVALPAEVHFQKVQL